MKAIKVGGVIKVTIGTDLPRTMAGSPVISQDNLRRHWSEPCCAFLDFWASLRTGVAVPTFRQFSERLSPRFTPNTYIVELEDDAAIVRFQGTELVERWRVDFTGRDIHDTFPRYFRSRALSNMRELATHPCGYLGRNSYTSSHGDQIISDCIQLPLAMDDGCLPRVVHFSAKDLESAPEAEPAKYYKTHKFEWLDLGAGTPPAPPLDLHINQPARS